MGNRTGTDLVVDPRELTGARREQVLNRLAGKLDGVTRRRAREAGRRGGEPAVRVGRRGPERAPGPGVLPRPARAPVPRRAAARQLPAHLPRGPARRARPRRHGEDQRRGGRRLPRPGLRRQRDRRQGRHRAGVRELPARHPRQLHPRGQRVGRADRPRGRVVPRAAPGPRRAAHDRRAHAAGAPGRAGRAGLAQRPLHRGGRRRARPEHGRGPGHGLLPGLRPLAVRHRLPEADRGRHLRPGQPAAQPGDRRQLPGRVDLQGDQRLGGPGGRLHHGRRADRVAVGDRALQDGLPELQEAVPRLREPAPGARGLERHLLLPTRRRVLPGPGIAAAGGGADLRPGRADRPRPARRDRRPDARPGVEAAELRGRPVHRPRPRLEAGRHDQPDGRPGLPRRDPAPDGGGLRRHRQRRHGLHAERRAPGARPQRARAPGAVHRARRPTRST